MLLLVEAGQLLGTLIRDDVPEEAERLEPALRFASTTGRTVGPDAPLDGVLATMLATGVRRLAVVDEGGALLGLLCLKRHLGGFCSDTDVGAGTLSAAEAGSVRAVDIPELIEEQRPEAASEGVEMDLEEDPDDASSAEELFRLSAR
jgi:hypothetical protein